VESTSRIVWGLLIVVALAVVNAFFVAAEYALEEEVDTIAGYIMSGPDNAAAQSGCAVDNQSASEMTSSLQWCFSSLRSSQTTQFCPHPFGNSQRAHVGPAMS
jgi:hypothetical protein